MWSRTDLDRYRWSGLLRPEQALERANLLLIRPYEPHKIPVVMVHGLISSPLAWIPMLNELLRDPVIQSRYQFLLYMYPTGVPIPIAAANLRESLLQARQMYDPEGREAAFDQTVLLGHSMGGLLSHAMAVSSGDQLWRLYSDRPFDEILGRARSSTSCTATSSSGRCRSCGESSSWRLRTAARTCRAAWSGGSAPTSSPSPTTSTSCSSAWSRKTPTPSTRAGFAGFPTSIETLEPNSPILLGAPRTCSRSPQRRSSFTRSSGRSARAP